MASTLALTQEGIDVAVAPSLTSPWVELPYPILMNIPVPALPAPTVRRHLNARHRKLEADRGLFAKLAATAVRQREIGDPHDHHLVRVEAIGRYRPRARTARRPGIGDAWANKTKRKSVEFEVGRLGGTRAPQLDRGRNDPPPEQSE